MQTIILGIFIVLHGLVHLLYAGQSWPAVRAQSQDDQGGIGVLINLAILSYTAWRISSRSSGYKRSG